MDAYCAGCGSKSGRCICSTSYAAVQTIVLDVGRAYSKRTHFGGNLTNSYTHKMKLPHLTKLKQSYSRNRVVKKMQDDQHITPNLTTMRVSTDKMCDMTLKLHDRSLLVAPDKPILKARIP